MWVDMYLRFTYCFWEWLANSHEPLHILSGWANKPENGLSLRMFCICMGRDKVTPLSGQLDITPSFGGAGAFLFKILRPLHLQY